MSATHITHFPNVTTGTGLGGIDVDLSNIRVGDRIILVHWSRSGSASVAPKYDSDTGDTAGFTSLSSSTSTGTLTAWEKFALPRDEGAPTYYVGLASGVEKQAIVALVLRGDDGIDVTPAYFPNIADTTPISPGVTTTTPRTRIYRFLGMVGAGTTVTSEPSDTDSVFDLADGGGGGIRFTCVREEQAAVGATGDADWEISSAQNSVGLTIAVREGELLRDYAPAASGAKKVYVEGYASKVGGSTTHVGHPLLITDSVLKANNLNMFESGHADAATEGSIRFSLDEAGAEPLPGKVFFESAVDPSNGKLEAYTRRPTNDGVSDSGNGVYMWWIPGSAKTQPAASAQHGSKSVQPHSYRLNIVGGGYTDETVHDNDATPTNTTLSTDVPYGHLESIDFNGASSRLNVADDDSLDLADGQSLTMLSWMIVDTDTGAFQGFMSKRQSLNHNYGAFYIADDGGDDGTFHANLYNGGFRGVEMDFNPNFSRSTWMPVFVEFEDVGTDYTKRIFNGTTLVNSATDAYEPIVNAHDLIIGATKTGTSTYGEWADGRRKGQRIIFEILSADVKTTIVNNESDNAAFWNGQWVYTDADGDGKGSAATDRNITFAITDSPEVFAATLARRGSIDLAINDSAEVFAATLARTGSIDAAIQDSAEVFAATLSRQGALSMDVEDSAEVFAASLSQGISRNLSFSLTDSPEVFSGSMSRVGALQFAITDSPEVFSASLLHDRNISFGITDSPEVFAAQLSQALVHRIRAKLIVKNDLRV